MLTASSKEEAEGELLFLQVLQRSCTSSRRSAYRYGGVQGRGRRWRAAGGNFFLKKIFSFVEQSGGAKVFQFLDYIGLYKIYDLRKI